MSAYADYLKKLTSTIAEAEKDARSLSEFVYKPVDFKVNRRLAPQINTLNYYIQFLESFKAVFTHETGYVQVGNKTVPTIGQALSDAMLSAGYEIVDSFEAGATLDKRNQVLRSSATGKLYKWGGDLPKVVGSGSTPESTGGYGDLAWSEVSDAALRQDLQGSVASGNGAALVNGAVLKVGDKEELKSFNPLAGTVITVSGSYGGAFEFDVSNLTDRVAGDPNQDFYIPPSADTSGASGAWVRVSGYPITDNFATPAPDNARLISTFDNQEYAYIGGSWVNVSSAVAAKIDSHLQDGNAHGLRSQNVSIGKGAVSTGTRSVSIGSNSESSSSNVVGWENTCTSVLSSVFGTECNILGSDASKRDNLILGKRLNVTDCTETAFLGSFTSAGSCSNSLLFGSSSAGFGNCVRSIILTTRRPEGAMPMGQRPLNVDRAIIIGSGASSRRELEGYAINPIAIGTDAICNYHNSIAIGTGVQTTNNNQIRIGNNNHTTIIDGDFSVKGTKNFMIPHPHPEKKDTHQLFHSSYEGDCEGGTIYRHHVVTKDGTATKDLPDWFKYLNKDVVVYVTPHKHFGAAYGEVEENTLTVTSNADGEYNVLIMGTRNDESVKSWKGVEVLNDNS